MSLLSGIRHKTDAPEAVLRYHSFDGGGPEYRAEFAQEGIVTYTCVRDYGKKSKEPVCGAPFFVVFTFRGAKAGCTKMKISSFSPIVPPEQDEYLVEVDDKLNVKLTLLGES